MTTQTRITLTNLKHAKNMSEETNAFTAVVCFDGQKVGHAKNDGHGGMTFVQPFQNTLTKLKEAEAYAESLSATECSFVGADGKPIMIPSSLDYIIDNMVMDDLVVGDLKRKLKRCALFTQPGKKGVFRMPLPRGRKLGDHLALIREKHPEWALLNDMPADEALAIWLKEV